MPPASRQAGAVAVQAAALLPQLSLVQGTVLHCCLNTNGCSKHLSLKRTVHTTVILGKKNMKAALFHEEREAAGWLGSCYLLRVHHRKCWDSVSSASYSSCVHFCQVRLPLLPICFLTGVVAKEEIVKQNLKCRDLLDEARNYHLHLSSKAVPDFEYSIRTTPRKQTAGNEMCVWLSSREQCGEKVAHLCRVR